jgi:hypothetical protein
MAATAGVNPLLDTAAAPHRHPHLLGSTTALATVRLGDRVRLTVGPPHHTV